MIEEKNKELNETDVNAELQLLLAMERDKLEKLKTQVAELKSKEAKNDKAG
jgi:hypothetical protein